METVSVDSISPQSSPAGETVIVVMDGNRGKGSLDALEWAITYIVSPNDTVVVLGVLPEIGKKYNPSCLPFNLGIGSSGIYIKLEFSTSGEMTPSELEKEIERKKREYQKFLEPYYHHCKKREVKLDIRLAAGLESKIIAVEEAQKLDPRWIVLDGHFKKDKEYILNHVECHVALLKTKGVATLIPSKITGPECEEWQIVCRKIDDQAFSADDFVEKPHSPKQTKPSSSSYPLSWRTGFPRPFSLGEINEITNGFNNVALKDHHSIIYGGVFGGFPVSVMCFPVDDQAVSLLKIVSRVRHRNILNLIGYCCIGDSVFFLCDCPKGSLEACLLCKYVLSDPNKGGCWVVGKNKVILYSIDRLCLVDWKLFLWSKFLYKLLVCHIHYFAGDKAATELSWDSRWGIALEIGAGIQYLHEEFVDGSIVNLSLCSSNVALVGSSCAMLFIYERTTKQLKLDDAPKSELLSVKGENIDMNEQLRADVKDYGVLLLELITGQSRRFFKKDGQCLVDWAFPLLEKNLLNQLLDPRLTKPTDLQVVNMARAALTCLKTDSSHNPTISEVLGIVRGK